MSKPNEWCLNDAGSVLKAQYSFLAGGHHTDWVNLDFRRGDDGADTLWKANVEIVLQFGPQGLVSVTVTDDVWERQPETALLKLELFIRKECAWVPKAAEYVSAARAAFRSEVIEARHRPSVH